MEYNHTVTIAAPEDTWTIANQLALAIGEQLSDDKTFSVQNAKIPQTDVAVCVCHFLTTQRVVDILRKKIPVTVPNHAPNVDIAAANRALKASRFKGPVQSDKISIRIDAPYDSAFASFEIESVTPPEEQPTIHLPVPGEISVLQAMIVVGEEKWQEAIAIANSDTFPWPMRAAILRATTLVRHSQTMDTIAWLLEYSPDQVDDLFREASKIEI